MDRHIKEFFSEISDKNPAANFQRVINLHESPGVSWEDVGDMVPNFCKGLYELTQLKVDDRIEFTNDYWLQKMVFRPHLAERLEIFFDRLDDIGVVIAQKIPGGCFEAFTVYSIKDDGGFYYGGSGMEEKEELMLINLFPEVILPEDYLAFMRIHNGFSKALDTGLIATHKMELVYNRFQEMLEFGNELVMEHGKPVDPKTLIPFYESFGMPFFQCFWTEWYPENEMGNVYFSGESWEISDVFRDEPTEDNMAFKNFNDWLLFYLEQVE